MNMNTNMNMNSNVNTLEKMTNRKKAAILLIALGKDYSSQILKYLNKDEVESAALDIANMKYITQEVRATILEEFYETCLAQKYISEGGIEYAREILNAALGEAKAKDVITKLMSMLQTKPFNFIKDIDPTQLFNIIKNEHPQTIALILSYLEPSKAATILTELTTERQTDVLVRIAKMNKTSPEYIKEVENIMEKKLASIVSTDYAIVGGVESIVSILNSVDRGTEKSILEVLSVHNMELAEEIKKKMFMFEDIIKLNNITVQRVLRDVDGKDLVIALKGSSKEVADIIFENVSKRRQETLREEIELLGPVRLRDVEDAQQRIVNIIRQLDEEGEITISRDKEDGMIV